MNRLTHREIEWYGDYAKSLEDEFDMEEVNDVMYRKLKALEDLEEDLDIDLFKLLSEIKEWLTNDHKIEVLEDDK